MLHSTELDQIAAALSAFQAEMPSVNKSHTATVPTKSGGQYSYRYADLADTVEAAAKLLSAHHLSVTQMPSYDFQNGVDVLTTMVLHTSGQWIKDTMRLFLSQESPQAHGSAITYARRYAYCAALGIVSDEDDDGAAAQNAPRPAQQAAQAPHPTRRRPPPQTESNAVENGRAAIKNQLLAECQGDQLLAKRLWAESPLASAEVMTRTEIDLLMSRARAEVEKS